MDYSKPTLFVLSGPNGAGKSTHVQAMLPEALKDLLSFDRDKTRSGFEVELLAKNESPESALKKAGKLMEERLLREMIRAIEIKSHFVLETPLSHADYWRYLDLFEDRGYQIQLSYLCLDKVSDCVARVGQRVLEGGHYVAPDTIKGVYKQNLQYIDEYRATFKIIELYDGMRIPTLLAKLEDNTVIYATESALGKAWLIKGLPVIGKEVRAFVFDQRKAFH